jgi:hypothetical protein
VVLAAADSVAAALILGSLLKNVVQKTKFDWLSKFLLRNWRRFLGELNLLNHIPENYWVAARFTTTSPQNPSE